MDSITQAALGAAIGQALLGTKIGNKAALVGAIVATIPDLDVILYAFFSPLEMLSIHRGFSHSISFSFIGAFTLTFLLTRFQWARGIGGRLMLVFTWLCLITHMLLDGCTAYGTQLLQPFSDSRLGLDCINVVDPLYSLPLIIGLVVSMIKRVPQPNKLGLIISSMYMLVAFGLKHTIVEDLVTGDLTERKIEYSEFRTVPVGIASVNWFAIARSSDILYLKKFSLMKGSTGDFKSFPIQEYLLDDVDPELAERMRWFAKDSYTVQERGSSLWFFNLQVDMRGFVDDGVQLSPTAGYFELKEATDGKWQFGTGTVLPK